MQGLARFSLVAVIVLAAILLGSWAYLVARYGGVDEYLASEDAPRYWQPSRSEAHDDLDSDEPDERSAAERAAAEVKSGKIPDDGSGGWRKAEPEKSPNETAPKTAEAAPENTIEARIDTQYSDLAIDTEEGTLKRGDSKSSLNPFFARTRPSASDRAGYTTSRAYMIASSKGGSDSPELQELHKRGYTLIRGKVCDDQKLEGMENVVVAPVTSKGELLTQRAVTNRDGEFVLYLAEDAAKQCGATERKANLCVIDDGRSPKASRLGKYQLNSEADANGVHEIKLEKSRGLRVRVRVANPRPVEDQVRVWCELRDESGPTFDDHIFMSVIAPATGDIVFRLPRGHFGQVRVGASGHGWAADALETDKLSKDLVAVQLTLRPARTSLWKGEVCANWYEDGAAGDTVAAARVAAVGTTDMTYTDGRGRFEFFARMESDEQPLRISTVRGFARTYSLKLRQKSDEELALVRSRFDTKKQSYEWQLLAPLDVTTTVVMDDLDTEKRQLRLLAVTQAANLRSRSSTEELANLWRSSVAVEKDRLEYSFESISWGAAAFVLYSAESSSKFDPVATFTCDPGFWDDPDVIITYPTPRDRCVVTVRMPIHRN